MHSTSGTGPSFPLETLTVQPWVDEVIDTVGHEVRSPYVEQFWLGLLGPSSTWLLRRLVAKGWIRIVRLRPNRLRYVLTPAGLAQKARLSRDYFLHSVRFYREARTTATLRLERLREGDDR